MAKKSWMNVVIKAALITGSVAVYVFVETGTRNQLSRMEDKIDRVETKIDEVSGYFKYKSEARTENGSPSGMKQ